MYYSIQSLGASEDDPLGIAEGLGKAFIWGLIFPMASAAAGALAGGIYGYKKNDFAGALIGTIVGAGLGLGAGIGGVTLYLKLTTP